MLYIETGRHEEVEEAKANLDISGQCSNYDAATAEAQTDSDEGWEKLTSNAEFMSLMNQYKQTCMTANQPFSEQGQGIIVALL